MLTITPIKKRRVGKPRMSKGMGYLLCFICVVIMIVLFISFKFGVQWPLEEDVNAPLNRAQVSAEAEDMLEWMNKVKAGMERRGMTHGYATIFKHTVDYDYEHIYTSVNNIIGRLERTIEMDKSSVEYQAAVDDIRGTARELDLRIGEYCIKHYGWWMTILGIFALLGAFIFGAIGQSSRY